jgi:hypothetical protein
VRATWWAIRVAGRCVDRHSAPELVASDISDETTRYSTVVATLVVSWICVKINAASRWDDLNQAAILRAHPARWFLAFSVDACDEAEIFDHCVAKVDGFTLGDLGERDVPIAVRPVFDNRGRAWDQQRQVDSRVAVAAFAPSSHLCFLTATTIRHEASGTAEPLNKELELARDSLE